MTPETALPTSVASFNPTPGHDVALLGDSFREASVMWERFGSPLFGVLAAGVAEDAEMLEIASHAPPGQPVNLLLLCAVHVLAMAERQDPLAAFFPLLVPTPRPAAEAFPAFRAFCLGHRRQLIELLKTRALQMMYPGRAALLLPAFGLAAERAGEPLSVIEIGCGAGFNLLFDQYGYEYSDGRRLGDAASPAQLRCELRGRPMPLPDHIPRVAHRVGVDLTPVDVTTPFERQWAEALLFPEWIAQRQVLRTGLDMRANSPLRIIAGDAMAVLPKLFDEIEGPLCLLNSHCLYQWPAAAREALDGFFRRASRKRLIQLIGLEQIGNVPHGHVQREWDRGQAKRSDLYLSVYEDGRAGTRVLGVNDGFGSWMEWEA